MAHYEDPAFSVTEDSSLWTAYTYAAAQPLSSYADDPTFTLPTTDAPDDVFGGGGAYYTPEQGDGLGFDSYLDPTMLAGAVPTSRLHPPSPSPGLPPLSSADSTPSSSSALPTPYGPFEASPPSALGPSGLLLPSAPIGETSSSSRFAKLQESYLERQQQPQVESRVTEQVFANEPTSHALAYSTSAPPLTPSRRTAGPSATQLWRSPSSHSVNSSPTKSPYAHRPKPYDRPSFESPTKDLDSPSRTIVRRPSVSSYNSDDLLASPTKAGGGGRRQRANLSIDVPSKFGLRSRLPVIAASPQVPYTDGRFPSNPDAAGSEAELSESTLQQVENLLQEFGPMARSGAFDSSASSSSGLDSYASSSASNDTRYCISGVALSLEDMAQLDDPALTAAFDSVSMQQYPASAPPYQTSFNISEPPSPSPYNLSVPNSQHLTPSPSYVHDSYPSQQQPVFEKWTPSGYVASRTTHASFGSHIRSISAPRTAYYPTEDDLASIPLQNPTSHSLAQTYSTHSLPSHASPPRIPQTLRRRSSVASGSPSTSSPWSHAPPRPQQAFHSYSYGPPPASPSSASQQQHSPYHNIPLPLRPAPPLESTVDVSPPPSPTKPSKAKSKAPAPVPSGTPSSSTASSPTKAVAATSPKKRRAGGSRARNPSAMFVNFSAADAKKLLSGVAPSGSSKKKREEEEAAAAAAAAAARGGFSEPPESTFHEPLHAQAPQHQASATL